MKKLIVAAFAFECAAAFLPLAAAEMVPVFGPVQFSRTTGRPNTFTESFQRCGTASSQIVIFNGNSDGSKRISSASIVLNGRQVIGPSDFNRKAGLIVKPVLLLDENQLTVRLASTPGSFITVEIESAESEVILSAGPAGASLPNPTNLLSAFRIINSGTISRARATRGRPDSGTT